MLMTRSLTPRGYERLSRDERSERTRELLQRLSTETDPAVADEVFEEVVHLNLRVARAIAARYRGRGVDDDDLEQVASQGLVKAVRGFDPQHGKDFLTYAVPTIRGEVQRHFRDASWTVRPPRRIQELQARINATMGRLAIDLGREPTQSEVLEDLEIGYGEYAEAVAAFGCFQPPSLDQPVESADDLRLGDTVVETRQDLEAAETRAILEPLLRRLSPEERRILHLRFVEDWTQQRISEECGTTQMQVSRSLASILKRLRNACSEEHLAGLARTA